MAAAMATDAPPYLPTSPTSVTPPARRRRSSSVPDRLAVMLFTIAAFLVVLALLARQLPTANYGGSRPVPVLRKIYRTTVIETIVGGSEPSGTSVSQSVSSSGATGTAATPTTRTS
jgi:hypothetical protein